MFSIRVFLLRSSACLLLISCTNPIDTKTLTVPVFSPPAGTYSNSQSVSISDAAAGTSIYYTADGTTPTTSSTVYSGPITVSSSKTLQAIATKSGYTNSPIATAAYSIGSGQTVLPAPTFNPAAGTYSSAQSVSITDATAGSTIYYTTGGSTPTTSSTVYSGPITVSSSETLEAIATESGYTNSPAATAAYTIGTVTSGECTSPVWSSSDPEGTDGIDNAGLWWVNNDAWSGSHGPQSIYVCNQSSWYAVSNQPDIQGQVETYPDTEYDVGGRSSLSTKTIAQYKSITSTFSEAFPSAGSWDAAYDLWLNNWGTEIMIWNEWAGAQAYWPGQSTQAVTLGGVPYHFYKNGSELMFFRDTMVKSDTVDILAALNWLVSQGLVKSTDVPTQLEYGVEICSTSGSETFPLTGLTFILN
jgi:hypothetical protein